MLSSCDALGRRAQRVHRAELRQLRRPPRCQGSGVCSREHITLSSCDALARRAQRVHRTGLRQLRPRHAVISGALSTTGSSLLQTETRGLLVQIHARSEAGACKGASAPAQSSLRRATSETGLRTERSHTGPLSLSYACSLADVVR